MTRLALSISVWLVLVGMLPGGSEAARPEAATGYELRGRGLAVSQIPLIVVDDGKSYVSAERLAAALKGKWTVRGARGILAVGTRSAEFTRDRAQVAVEGRAVALGSAPRVSSSGWLLPHDFLLRGLDRLAPGVAAARLATAQAAPQPPKPPVKPARQIEPQVPYEELRYRSYPSFTRVVIETGGVLRHETDVLAGEVRVRLPNLAVSGPRAEDVDDGLVKRIRLEPAGEGAVLRTFLTGVPAEVRTASLQDPHRLVIDIYRPRGAIEPEAPGTGGQGLRLIVIDPGHGGHDPGATGPSGLAEKEVVLDVSRRVARLVEEGLGIKVAMTRGTDVFIPLRDRTNFANRQRADLFVSIHANAHPRSFSEGVETYFLSSEATDNEARQVAAIENGVVQLESPAQRQRTDVLKSILWDLAQSEFQQESSFMAETVQDLMTRSLSLVNRGVKQAGFYVLGGAAMPAILIEVGFLTNPREEKKLGSPAHREAVARAIYAGLAEYKGRYDQRMRAAQTPAAVPARIAPPRSEPR